MKLGCCSWSYHRSLERRRLTFYEWLRLCSEELQVGGVDIIAEQMPSRTRRCWLEVRKRCTDGRLSIACLSPGNDFGKPTAIARRRQVDNVRRWIETAVILGAPCLRIFAGWAPPGEAARRWPRMVACVRRVARDAAQAGVTLVVEPHDEGGFLSTSRATLRLIHELESPWVRINLDVGNYREADLYGGLERSLPYAPHVVAKVHRLSPGGEELTLDYGRIFRMLKRRHYQGFITLEYEGQLDERIGVPKSLMMLRRYARRVGFAG